MKRKMSNLLLKWKKDKNKMPLIVHGARQVGKTYTILSFGKENYKNVAYINFEDNKDFAKIFEQDFNIERIIKELSVRLGITILEEDTLIFFDEIQTCERALTSLKYFEESNTNYNVIAAGSLLGVAINREKHSFPVGKVKIITLYPLDFEEFLWAMDKEELANMIRQSFKENKELSLHNMANEYYRLYLAIGGMPRAILEYKEKQDMDFVTSILKDINNSYIADMAKYASATETTKIIAVYNIISAQLAKENKKFQYKLIKSGARAYEYENAINWLNASGIITQCIKIKEGKIPLSAFIEPDSFKIYMNDIGLLRRMSNLDSRIVIEGDRLFEEFKGAFTENYVLNMLCIIFDNVPNYFIFNRYEIDFVFQYKNDIIPIEVKAKKSNNNISLTRYNEKYGNNVSIRFSMNNLKKDGKVINIPLFLIEYIENFLNFGDF